MISLTAFYTLSLCTYTFRLISLCILLTAIIIISLALIYCVGEVVYVDDIPSPINCLHGAFIYSTKPLAWVKSIKFNQKTYQDGVAAVISCKDIPEHGNNVGSMTLFGTEPLFADELTRFAGQCLALVVIS